MRVCKTCKIEKLKEDFYPIRKNKNSGKQYYMSSCKPCESERAKKRNKNHGRGEHLKRRYNLTETQFDHILSRQDWSCAICSLHVVDGFKPQVDHCHRTGEIRGLLCGNCNRGLGMFKNNSQLLQEAMKYVTN